MSNKFIVPAILLILVIAAGYWVTMPKNYDDCVLKHIDEAKTVLAAHIIEEACSNKFPSNLDKALQQKYEEETLAERILREREKRNE